MDWTRRLKPVFGLVPEHFANCGGWKMPMIAAILEPPAVEKILIHLGLDPLASPKGRAREAGQDCAAA